MAEPNLPGYATAAAVKSALDKANKGVDPHVYVVGDRQFSISAFSCDGLTYDGGSITVPSDGDWYIGVDLFLRLAISLPRLGHSGWIPLAMVRSDGNGSRVIEAYQARIPKSHIKQAIYDLSLNDEAVICVMGSSLLYSNNTPQDWCGMLFNSASSTDDYAIAAEQRNLAKGGSPAQMQLAQLGYVSSHSANGINSTGSPALLTFKSAPNGKSCALNGASLVIVGLMANAIDYSIESVEAVFRNLYQAGVPVIVVTDNPADATESYASLTGSSLYSNGYSIIDLANKYGFAVSDTASYMVDAALRYGLSTVYRDTIHPSFGDPAGTDSDPSCGYEVWARAIRSTLPVSTSGNNYYTLYDFSSASVPQEFTANANTSLSVVSGALLITQSTAGQSWGVDVAIPVVPSGTAINVTFLQSLNATNSPYATINVRNSSQTVVSNTAYQGAGNRSITLTTTNNFSSGFIRFHFSSTMDGSATVDNLVISIPSLANLTNEDMYPLQASGRRPSMPLLKHLDYKIPGAAFVIVPSDEYLVSVNDAASGTLSQSPLGANSFARIVSPVVNVSEDLLVLSTGEEAVISGNNVCGFSLVQYASDTDGAVELSVSEGGSQVTTVSIPARPYSHEWYVPIISPSDLGASGLDNGRSIKITVTSGTLKVAALIALTAEQEYIPHGDINYIGTWDTEQSNAGIDGHYTDTENDYAVVNADGALQWLLSRTASASSVEYVSGASGETVSVSGSNESICVGGKKAPVHFLRCVGTTSGSPGDRGVSVGGAILVTDR